MTAVIVYWVCVVCGVLHNVLGIVRIVASVDDCGVLFVIDVGCCVCGGWQCLLINV